MLVYEICVQNTSNGMLVYEIGIQNTSNGMLVYEITIQNTGPQPDKYAGLAVAAGTQLIEPSSTLSHHTQLHLHALRALQLRKQQCVAPKCSACL